MAWPFLDLKLGQHGTQVWTQGAGDDEFITSTLDGAHEMPEWSGSVTAGRRRTSTSSSPRACKRARIPCSAA